MPDRGYTLSPSGQRIYQHKPLEHDGLILPINWSVYQQDIEQYLEKAFGPRESFVSHELVSDIVHIDIYVLLPTDQDNRCILFSSGMSDLPMTMPPELLPEYAHLQRAELVMYLPGEWDIKNKDDEWFWPIKLVSLLARLPHQFETWLGHGHSIPSGCDNAPYAKNTKLCGCVLYCFNQPDNPIMASDGTDIQIYTIVPVYRQEMNYKLKNNADKLLAKLKKAGISETVNITRKNVCSLF